MYTVISTSVLIDFSLSLSLSLSALGSDVVCTWSGQLPPRRHKNPTYSPRVFLGGVPWDITESTLLQTFQVFGSLSIDWPGKDSKHNRHPPKGVCVCVLEREYCSP